jgi:hypothetical protein
MNEEITARMYLIGQALNGLLAHGGSAKGERETAERAIVMADAVLAHLHAHPPVEQWRVPAPKDPK